MITKRFKLANKARVAPGTDNVINGTWPAFHPLPFFISVRRIRQTNVYVDSTRYQKQYWTCAMITSRFVFGGWKRSQKRESFRLEKSASSDGGKRRKKGYHCAQHLFFMCMELMENLHNNMPKWMKTEHNRGESERKSIKARNTCWKRLIIQTAITNRKSSFPCRRLAVLEMLKRNSKTKWELKVKFMVAEKVMMVRKIQSKKRLVTLWGGIT